MGGMVGESLKGLDQDQAELIIEMLNLNSLMSKIRQAQELHY